MSIVFLVVIIIAFVSYVVVTTANEMKKENESEEHHPAPQPHKETVVIPPTFNVPEGYKATSLPMWDNKNACYVCEFESPEGKIFQVTETGKMLYRGTVSIPIQYKKAVPASTPNTPSKEDKTLQQAALNWIGKKVQVLSKSFVQAQRKKYSWWYIPKKMLPDNDALIRQIGEEMSAIHGFADWKYEDEKLQFFIKNN